MKAMRRKLAALALGLLLLPALAACGGTDGGGEAGGTVYKPTFLRCQTGMSYVSAGCAGDGELYILGTAEDRPAISRVDLDGAVTPLAEYAPLSGPDGAEGQVGSPRPGEDGTLWVTEELTAPLQTAEDGEAVDAWDTRTIRVRRQLDSAGRELRRVDFDELAQRLGVSYIDDIFPDGAGRLYALAGESVAVLDGEMNVLFTLSGEDLFGDLIRLGDGAMAMSRWNDAGDRTLRTIDPAARDWGTEYVLPYGAENVFPGSGGFLYCYDRGDSLWGVTAAGAAGGAESPAGKLLVRWSNVDVEHADVLFFSLLPDGRIAAVTSSAADGPRTELVLLTETDRAAEDRTVLTFATLGLDYQTRSRIIDFNRTNGKYRIEIRDYGQYNTGDDGSAGLTRLNTEIGAGSVPDILDVRGLPIRQYGAKGLLEDLWPYIESDPDLGREALVESVFRAAEQDGALYQIFDGFTIATAAGASQVVGDRTRWTMDELLAALQTMPQGCQISGEGNTKGSMLELTVLRDLDRFVDWETGTCGFDSQEFIDALRLCDAFPLDFDWSAVDWEDYQTDFERVRGGKQMLYDGDLTCFEDLQMLDALFGGPAAFVGYPTSGRCGSAFRVDRGQVMAMSSACKDKEGAWTFLRELLLPREDGEDWFYRFPSNRRDFDAMAEKAMTQEMTLDENGQEVAAPHGGVAGEGFSVDFYAMTQEQLDRFMALCEAIDTVAEGGDGVAGVVREGTRAFFNGDESAEDAARQIQSRVKLYLGEQS